MKAAALSFTGRHRPFSSRKKNGVFFSACIRFTHPIRTSKTDVILYVGVLLVAQDDIG